ncbi:MAG: 1-deoxy-D-xylulose-5-phosphate synthase [Candidatus Aminicenantes bacterium RBG_16_63_16]|nr:MAG: 1-deoxy-D-xylulose-5-phosphate synthase [Candidatus Aminicenantes bacterium RBG_16_63_16]
MPRILDGINSPEDLKRVAPDQLPALADEIRSLIIEVVSKNGGHLASNLGVVELTLALHYVFDSPRDKIIWDVGHQCYTHKILTGRKDRFFTLRRAGGLLGFPDRKESEHDIYNTGHASTALSAAVGVAVARDKNNENFKVIAVVGDGGLTGGVAWEALNQIGHLREKIIIVLNYNEMSISTNVGAMSKYLTYLVSGQHYLRIKDRAKTLLKSIPRFGWPLIRAGRAVEDAIKKVFFPGLVFEELGIRYIGPVQGHSLPSLIEVFNEAKTYDGPVLIHCVTQKGRGYAPAQNNPERFHGTAPFNRSTGEPLAGDSRPTFSKVFGEMLLRLARQDPKIIAITAAMPEGTGLSCFAREFPDRLYDVGIAEQHAVSFAAGLALRGFKPVVAIYSTFLQRAYDQLYHDVSLQDLPVVFALDRAGVVSDDGPTHQGVNDIIYLLHLPNMIVMAPKDEGELERMLKSALAWGHPAAIRFPKGSGVGVSLDAEPREISPGESELIRPGEVLVAALGSMVYPALAAAERLEREGFSLAVLNARFAKPIDKEAILAFARPGNTIITVEEGVVRGGFGSAVREILDREGRFGIRFKSIGLPIEIYPVGKADEIRRAYHLDADGLTDEFRAVLRTWRQPEHD